MRWLHETGTRWHVGLIRYKRQQKTTKHNKTQTIQNHEYKRTNST